MSIESEIRMERMRRFLREFHGKDPSPRRCFMEHAEVLSVMAHSPASAAVTKDLNITGYGIRWRNAVESMICDGRDPQTWDFWMGARLHFIEIGGCYAEACEPPQRRFA